MPRWPSQWAQAAFTLLELMLVLLIGAILAAIAYVGYESAIERARIADATADILEVSLNLEAWATRFENNGQLPATLADAGIANREDPWGNEYEYLRIQGLGNHGHVRKDRNLVPLNTDFDLYSKGPDGASRSPLTARQSRDDIVRARNGAFIGVAEDY